MTEQPGQQCETCIFIRNTSTLKLCTCPAQVEMNTGIQPLCRLINPNFVCALWERKPERIECMEGVKVEHCTPTEARFGGAVGGGKTGQMYASIFGESLEAASESCEPEPESSTGLFLSTGCRDCCETPCLCEDRDFRGMELKSLQQMMERWWAYRKTLFGKATPSRDCLYAMVILAHGIIGVTDVPWKKVKQALKCVKVLDTIFTATNMDFQVRIQNAASTPQDHPDTEKVIPVGSVTDLLSLIQTEVGSKLYGINDDRIKTSTQRQV